MLLLVEHAQTGETYAMVVENDWRSESGEAIGGAWPVPRTAVLLADGSLWCHWDVECWQRVPSNAGPDGQPLEYHIATWAEEQSWRTLAEV